MFPSSLDSLTPVYLYQGFPHSSEGWDGHQVGFEMDKESVYCEEDK